MQPSISRQKALYISVQPKWWGGGANTFAHNLVRFAKQNGIALTRRIDTARRAVIISHLADPAEVERARANGCLVIHRIDEDFNWNKDDPSRRQKHEQIRRLNEHADVTVFQSKFVEQNLYPVLQPKRHTVILNGGNPSQFRPARRPGAWIGHVTWSVGDKKRLDLLYQCIEAHPDKRFLLVGQHAASPLPFKKLPNAKLVGRAFRFMMPYYYRKMAALYFPSQDDPCPNTAVEAILSGVPVCYNERGGTREIVQDCGLPLERFDELCADAAQYRDRCAQRRDLNFSAVAEKYIALT